MLRNVDTTVERTTVSNDSGVYVFVNVPPGLYTLDVRQEGFSRSTLEPFRLAVDQTATFDFELAVGVVAETVSVAASATEVQSSTSELGSIVSAKQVIDLPLNGRNFTQLLAMTPGADSELVLAKRWHRLQRKPDRRQLQFSRHQRTNQPQQFLRLGRHLQYGAVQQRLCGAADCGLRPRI